MFLITIIISGSFYAGFESLIEEKDLSINEELEKMRLITTSSLLSGRRDIIVVASVSCVMVLKPGRISEECDCD